MLVKTVSLLVVALLTLTRALGGPSAALASDGQSVSAELGSSHLRIQEPVSIYGPFPTLVREVNVMDLVELQVSYPISPPFPKGIEAKVGNRALTALWIASTDGQVVALTPKPQAGKIGVGFISVYLKANSPGESTVEVTVTLADGSKKVVPFVFAIRRREGKSEAESTPARALQDEHVYAYPVPLKATDKLCDGPQGEPMPIAEGTRLIWVDLMPTARFAHPTLYVLVDGLEAKTVRGQWWPELNGKRILLGAAAPLLIRQ